MSKARQAGRSQEISIPIAGIHSKLKRATVKPQHRQEIWKQGDMASLLPPGVLLMVAITACLLLLGLGPQSPGLKTQPVQQTLHFTESKSVGLGKRGWEIAQPSGGILEPDLLGSSSDASCVASSGLP